MDKIIRLAVLLREAQEIVDELRDSDYSVIRCSVTYSGSGDEKISVLIRDSLDSFHVPYTRERNDGDTFDYEDSVILGGVKFHTYSNEVGTNAKVAV